MGKIAYRNAILKKYNKKCAKCGCEINKNNKSIHHIYNKGDSFFSCLINNENNGILFCRDCHIIFHKKYGYKNNCLEQVNDFLNK